jgi:mRNA-degrading endonuclease toxin of MazEF toxin-antitoxin module
VNRDAYAAGSIYFVADDKIVLPEAGRRQLHRERRPVLIVSDLGGLNQTNCNETWPSVWVVPVSSSTTYKTRFDIKIAAGDGNLAKKGWARVPALQVMDKSYLQDLVGIVHRTTLESVIAQVLSYLGDVFEDDDEDEGTYEAYDDKESDCESDDEPW